MAGAFPHVWSHACGSVSPTQKSADPEMFVGVVQVSPPSWETES